MCRRCIFAVTVAGTVGQPAGLIVAALAVLTSLWINICVTIKRYHDLGKSGVWFLLVFLPIIGPIWQAVECGFVSGNIDANDYGPPPGSGSSLSFGSGDEPGALAGKEIDFAKYRLTQPVIVAGPAATSGSMSRAAPARPTFGKRA